MIQKKRQGYGFLDLCFLIGSIQNGVARCDTKRLAVALSSSDLSTPSIELGDGIINTHSRLDGPGHGKVQHIGQFFRHVLWSIGFRELLCFFDEFVPQQRWVVEQTLGIGACGCRPHSILHDLFQMSQSVWSAPTSQRLQMTKSRSIGGTGRRTALGHREPQRITIAVQVDSVQGLVMSRCIALAPETVAAATIVYTTTAA
jgi:hypothetical protein